MENRQQQILSEIQSMMASIRVQLEKLDVKIAEFQQTVDIEGVGSGPIDLEIDDAYFAEEQVTDMELDIPEAVADIVVEPEPVVEVTEPEPAPVGPEPVMETVEPVLSADVVEAEPIVEVVATVPVEDDDDDLPLFGEPESIFEVAQKSQKSRKAVIDVMEDKQAWRTDMPGAPVRDLLSVISLNDRVQFINVLFKEDPAAFQQARARINMMETLDEVVEYVTSEFDWDMNSQVVYRFMMAVRRKVK
jgi:hypothetical protein